MGEFGVVPKYRGALGKRERERHSRTELKTAVNGRAMFRPMNMLVLN